MSKRLPKDVDEQVLRHVRNSPEGLRIKALLNLLGDQISRRSLQRLLSGLVEAGKLVAEQKGRSTRYLQLGSVDETKEGRGLRSTVAVRGKGAAGSAKVTDRAHPGQLQARIP